jgi:ketosteroid isomerase-like protein
MSNVDTAKYALRAFSQGDLAALKEFHSEDAVYELHGFSAPGRWYSPGEIRPGGEVRGRDAIIDIFFRLPDYWSTVIIEPSEYIDGGEYVGVLGTVRFADNKRSEELSFVLVLRFGCDGKAVQAELHATARNWPTILYRRRHLKASDDLVGKRFALPYKSGHRFRTSP